MFTLYKNLRGRRGGAGAGAAAAAAAWNGGSLLVEVGFMVG